MNHVSQNSATLKIGNMVPTPQASSPAPTETPIFKFVREDWTLFRSVGTLTQKAGAPANRLRRLVLKELADNALDAGGNVLVGELPDGGYFVQDDGPGIGGTPEDIARMFSIARPLVSSKLWRLPTRGALGNGLRVVTGAVAASGGTLRVLTRNQLLELTLQDDGSTAVAATPADFPRGTRVEISFGPNLPGDDDALRWAELLVQMARGGEMHSISDYVLLTNFLYQELTLIGFKPGKTLAV
ncbi:MAG: ATP-binding protein [Rhodospirillaceae bacterium]